MVSTVSQALAPRPLQRRTDRRVAAGVAGGLADWLKVDVAWVRLVILCVMAGAGNAGLIAYAVAAAVLPPPGHALPSWDNLVGLCRLGVLLFGAAIFNGSRILLDGSPNVWLPLDAIMLLGLATLLAAGYASSSAAQYVDARTRVLAWTPVAAFGGAIAAGVVVAPAFRWDVLVPFGAVLASAILGAKAWSGSWRPFVAPALVTTVFAIGFVAADIDLRGGVGNVDLAPTDARAVPSDVERAVGRVEIDLTGLPRDSPPLRIDTHVGIGDLTLTVPEGSRVDIDARVGRGTIDAPSLSSEPESSVFGVTTKRRLPTQDWRFGGTRGKPRLSVTLRARVGAGSIEIAEVDS